MHWIGAWIRPPVPAHFTSHPQLTSLVVAVIGVRRMLKMKTSCPVCALQHLALRFEHLNYSSCLRYLPSLTIIIILPHFLCFYASTFAIGCQTFSTRWTSLREFHRHEPQSLSHYACIISHSRVLPAQVEERSQSGTFRRCHRTRPLCRPLILLNEVKLNLAP